MLPLLPSWAQPKALEVFRFAHYAFKLGGWLRSDDLGVQLYDFHDLGGTGLYRVCIGWSSFLFSVFFFFGF